SQTQQFTAGVVNAGNNTAVTWFVDNVPNGNADVGTISTGGLYTPPTTLGTQLGTHTIKAISQADPTMSSTGRITITTRPSLGIFPSAASILVSTDQTFQAQICTVPDNNVTFSVDSIPGGNAAVGTVTSSGVYTAPSRPGRHTVSATDASLNLTSGAGAIIYSKVTVDFAARSNPVYPILPDVFGANHADSLRATDIPLVAGAVSGTRTLAKIPVVYATGLQTPDWTKIDPQIASLKAAGLRPILQLTATPPFLQPSPSPCGTNSVPTDVNQWGQIAASYVAHMDATFQDAGKPFVQDYEIWNEPNTGALCGSKVSDYLAIYAAAAPLMKAQDSSIRIGGPAVSGFSVTFTSGVLSDPFVSGLLSDSRTAPYVDFISYHQYLFGAGNQEAKWDTFNGTESVYQRMQEASTGVSGTFLRADALAANGNQPQPPGTRTPIYLDEFNANNARVADCCRNDPTFSPLYNGLTAVDLLNTVYFGALQVPAKLTYFAANAAPFLCLIGTVDSAMDCQYGSAPQPYPQYYLYQLLTSPSFLGLRSGGFLSPAVSPPAAAGGLAVSGFYTATQDTIFIVNPTATSFPQVSIEAQNTGYTSPSGTLYQIVNGQSISQSPQALTLVPAGETTYTATIAVPAYTVLALAIQGTPDQDPRSVKGIVSASPEPSLRQMPFTISATISALNGGSNTPTGTVALSIDGAILGTPNLVNGTASVPGPTTTSVGSHTITAVYSGDANFNAATFSATHVVTVLSTGTILQGTPNPASAGQPVVFTANVTYKNAPMVGTVTFADGTATLGGPVTLDASGNATFTTTTLAVGSHIITAIYSGNVQFGSSSASIIQVIVIAPTTTTLTSSLNPSQFGQNVTFTATVAAASGVPTGGVNFFDGGAALGSGSLNAQGVATFSTSGLSVGTHTITAAYQGSGLFAQSTSAALAQVVQAAVIPPDFALTVTPPRIKILRGEVALYAVTLTPLNSFNGVVNFTCSVGGAPQTTCGFSPAALNTSGLTTLSVITGAAHPTIARDRASRTTLVMASLFCCLLLRRRKWQSTAFLLIALFAGIGGLSGCGSNGNLGTTAGTYTITVTGTSNTGTTITHTATAQLKVT
ncbi:MAG TPA: Ig-like domain repeat protein, partial [Acidobacteriaceae bacterium]|nr:Ig-like domain repeat protein [Acidobacteriaceae bacterium]